MREEIPVFPLGGPEGFLVEPLGDTLAPVFPLGGPEGVLVEPLVFPLGGPEGFLVDPLLPVFPVGRLDVGAVAQTPFQKNK